MLPVLAGCIGRKRLIAVNGGSWIETARLWMMVIGDSGTRKSPAFRIAVQPLKVWQSDLRELYEAELRLYNSLPAEGKIGAEKPKRKRAWTSDATLEGLNKVLDHNSNGVTYLCDEVVGWIRGWNQYKGGQGNDRQLYLSVWSGESICKDRASLPEPIEIDDPLLNVVGGAQPDKLKDIIDDSCDDGGPARFLYAFPGDRLPEDYLEKQVDGEQDYLKLCRGLQSMNFRPKPLNLAADAKDLWIAWLNHHRREKPFANLKPNWQKLEGYSLSLALILFLVRQAAGEAKGEAIDRKSVTGAVQLIEYFKAHAVKSYTVATDREGEKRFERAWRWVVKRYKQKDIISVRLAQMCGVAGVRTSDEARGLFVALSEQGYGVFWEASDTFTPHANLAQQPNK